MTAAEWARVAVLTSFAMPLAHATAANLPLLVLPPNRLRILNPVQSLQVMLSQQVTRSGHAKRCASLANLMPSVDARDALYPFMLTLLARWVTAGKVASDVDERRIVEDMWLDPLVQRRWRRPALRLTEADCRRIGRIAAERGLGGRGIRWLGADAAIDGWALKSAGYAAQTVGRVPAADDRVGSTALPEARRAMGRPASRNTQLTLAISNE